MWYRKIVVHVIGLMMVATFVANSPSAANAAQANYPQTFSNKNATGEELANAFFELLYNTGSPTGVVGTTTEQDNASKALVRPYLDPAFMLQRSTGERYIAETYLPADVDHFELGDVRTTRPADDVLVVRYSIRTSQTLPDAALVMSSDKAPRLTVFHWSDADSRWKILSHGNFNTPIAAICDSKPLVNNGLTSPASAEDQRLGESLMSDFIALLVEGDAGSMQSPFVQLQSAGGVGYTTLAERKKPTKLPQATFSDAIVTRNGRLLNLSVYYTTPEEILMREHKLRSGGMPILKTFMQDDDGMWKVIAINHFAPPAELPAGVECVPAGNLERVP